MKGRINKCIKSAVENYTHVLQDDILQEKIQEIVIKSIAAFRDDKKMFLCGNGGSASDAQHIAAELSGRFYADRPPLYAEALHVNSSFMTAVANDYGYEQYEISNWSKPKLECRHNLHYWEIEPCLAFGPSAHGFDGESRFSNISNLDQYIKKIELGEHPQVHKEKLSNKNYTNELIGFGLRISNGINLDKISVPRIIAIAKRSGSGRCPHLMTIIQSAPLEQITISIFIGTAGSHLCCAQVAI